MSSSGAAADTHTQTCVSGLVVRVRRGGAEKLPAVAEVSLSPTSQFRSDFSAATRETAPAHILGPLEREESEIDENLTFTCACIVVHVREEAKLNKGMVVDSDVLLFRAEAQRRLTEVTFVVQSLICLKTVSDCQRHARRSKSLCSSSDGKNEKYYTRYTFE